MTISLFVIILTDYVYIYNILVEFSLVKLLQ